MSTKIALREQRRRDVVSAIVVRGERPSVVSRVYGVSERNIFNWLSLYRSGGWGALKEGARSGRPRKLTGKDMRWIYDTVSMGNPLQHRFDFCLWTLKTIKELIKRELGVDLSKSSVWRLLSHLGLSAQRPLFKSYKQDKKKVKAYLEQHFPTAMNGLKKQGAKLFFIDEASLRSDSHRGLTWGKKGETPVVKNGGGRFGLNMVSAVSPRGDMRFSVIKDKMNSKTFIGFLKKLYRDAGTPIVVVADNARYHHSRETQTFIESTDGDIQLVFLPAYSPELNPDEQVWNHAKRELGKRSILNVDEMKTAVKSVMCSIQKKKKLIQSFFKMQDTKYILDALHEVKILLERLILYSSII